jgi:hypothetical protein
VTPPLLTQPLPILEGGSQGGGEATLLNLDGEKTDDYKAARSGGSSPTMTPHLAKAIVALEAHLFQPSSENQATDENHQKKPLSF